MGGKVLELESERLLSEGEKKGEANLGKLVSALLKDKRYSDIEKVSVDEHYREKLYKEFDM